LSFLFYGLQPTITVTKYATLHYYRLHICRNLCIGL